MRWYVQIVSEKASQSTPFLFHKVGGRGRGGGSNFLKLIEMGRGVWKVLLQKGRKVKMLGKGGGLSRKGGELPWRFSGDSSWCSIEKQSWCVYLSFANKYFLWLYKNCLCNDWHCNNFNRVDIVIIVVLIIHGNKKHSAWYFYFSYNANKHVLEIIS